MAFLYQITSPSGKRYIGVTTRSVEERWQQHVWDSTSGNLALHAAILKYGPEAFEVRTLAQVEDSEMFELEKRAIAALGTKAPLGYNLTDGGDGGPPFRGPHTPEAIAKNREAHLGRGHTDETRLKMSRSHTGSKSPPGVGAKIAEANRRREITPEMRLNMSRAQSARWARQRGESQ